MQQKSTVKEREKTGDWRLSINLLCSYYLNCCGITVAPCLLYKGKTSLSISGLYDLRVLCFTA
jgi:hypothetical protein